MQLQLIRQGSSGASVLAWEEFLRGDEHYLVEVDGVFNRDTHDATRDFQQKYHLDVDGVVGGETWGQAIKLGLDVLEDTSTDQTSLNWPPKPAFGPTDYAEREELFGHIEYVAAPIKGNPEAVRITNHWTKDNITSLIIPQLAKVQGVTYKGQRVGRGPHGKVPMHEKIVEPMLELWQAWEDEGLLYLIKTWAGLWVPRFVRGSRTYLSNHAYGSAFDINAPWNGLRRTPALVGQKGSVRLLVPTANELGWYWLGHGKRKDGMHFEYVGG